MNKGKSIFCLAEGANDGLSMQVLSKESAYCNFQVSELF